ncbi:MAG: DNRLRE domain-containing protein [Clostridia bacterium]|nr:DNRLRE domain-containing protein [Clostridia bacterium]
MKKQYKGNCLFLTAFLLFVFFMTSVPVLAEQASHRRVLPIADTYVDGSNPNVNFSTEAVLKAKNTPNSESSNRIAYLKFAVPELDGEEQVFLRLYMKINDSHADSSSQLTCSLALAESGWEDTVTYETRPETNDTVAQFTVSGISYLPYDVAVTEAVQAAAKTGDAEITFAYLGGKDYITSIYSQEAEEVLCRPCLYITEPLSFLDGNKEPLEGLQANSQVYCRMERTVSGGKVILAVYENGNLVDADIKTAQEGAELSVTTGSDVGGQRLCVFLWDENLSPLDDKIVFHNPFSVSKPLLTELAESGESALVKEDSHGVLTYYPYTEQGDTLPDFSGVGYMGGSEKFPTSVKVQTVLPLGNMQDDTTSIQQAIDKVSTWEPDANGIRGVVKLANGDYYISGTLQISESGVILRGESQAGTVIHATGDGTQSAVLAVSGAATITMEETGRKIALDYVPVGTTKLPLESTAGLSVGDEVVVVRPPSEQWIADIGMDASGIFAQSSTAVPWRARDYEFHFERKIVAVDEDSITIDHPIVMSMETKYGGGEVRKVPENQRISQVGVECLTFDANYDETEVSGSTYIDEDHADKAVAFGNAEDCWAKDITAKHFINECVEIGSSAKYVTVTDCSALAFVSTIAGSRRYGFEINGQLCLVKDCYTDGARHAFAQGARVCGPNVFYACTSVNDYNTSETHHRWAVGTLYDNVIVSRGLQAVQRGDYGTGHGWAGANIVFWNCGAPHIGVMQPPTAQNFAIGISAVPAANTASIALQLIQSINKQAGTNFVYNGYPFAGDGYMELQNRPAKITSLYQAQQNNRTEE